MTICHACSRSLFPSCFSCPRDFLWQLLFVFRFLASALAPNPSNAAAPSSTTHAAASAVICKSEDFLLISIRCLQAATSSLRACGACSACLSSRGRGPNQSSAERRSSSDGSGVVAAALNHAGSPSLAVASTMALPAPNHSNTAAVRSASTPAASSHSHTISSNSASTHDAPQPSSALLSTAPPCALSFLRSEAAAPLLGHLLSALLQLAEGEARRGSLGSRELRLGCLQALHGLIEQVGAPGTLYRMRYEGAVAVLKASVQISLPPSPVLS